MSSAVLSSVAESQYDSRSKTSSDSESLSESSDSKYRRLLAGQAGRDLGKEASNFRFRV